MNIWSRLGVSVAIAAVFCILLTEFFQHTASYQSLRWYACIFFALAGISSSAIGITIRRTEKRQRHSPGSGGVDPISHSSAGAHLLFWGPISAAFAGVVLLLPYREREHPHVEARAIPRPAKTSAPIAVITASAPASPLTETNAPVFPDLKVQGLVFRPPRNAVIVRGHTYFVGDKIDSARVFSITADTVVLQIGDFFKAFTIDPIFQPRRG